MFYFSVFFFSSRRRHTRWTGDWSSDVCSSDLILAAAVGGIMVPRFVMPEAMQKLSEVSPMAWALDAFHAVILRGGGAADIAAPCAKLLALAAALFAAALWVHYRRRVLTSAQ